MELFIEMSQVKVLSNSLDLFDQDFLNFGIRVRVFLDFE